MPLTIWLRITFLFTAVFCVFAFFPKPAMASGGTCWESGSVALVFQVTAGQLSETHNTMHVTCLSNSLPAYFRVCISTQNGNAIALKRDYPAGTINFNLQSTGTGGSAGGAWFEGTGALSQGTQTVINIPVKAIISGASSRGAGGTYHVYSMPLAMSYASSSDPNNISECGAPGSTSSTYNAVSATAKVEEGCDITTTDMDFGYLSNRNGQISGSTMATLTTNCSSGTHYKISLDYGQHFSGRQRYACKDSSNCVRYNLLKDDSSTWGGSINEVSGTSDGVHANAHLVHGEVPAQPTPDGGQYFDTIIVTLTY